MNKVQDLDLRKDIVDELEWDPSVDARMIGVTVEDGIVALTGHVMSYAEKIAAEKTVKRVHGVAAVANDLEVRLPAIGKRDDIDIARSALNALEWNVSIPRNRITVSVADAWLTLDGDVDWQYQKRAAEDAVRSLTGVRGVTNAVRVLARHASASDVRDKIESALRRNAELDAENIIVDAADGRITLTGTVRSWIERDDAVNAAWSAPGVTTVVDHLRIHV